MEPVKLGSLHNWIVVGSIMLIFYALLYEFDLVLFHKTRLNTQPSVTAKGNP